MYLRIEIILNGVADIYRQHHQLNLTQSLLAQTRRLLHFNQNCARVITHQCFNGLAKSTTNVRCVR